MNRASSLAAAPNEDTLFSPLTKLPAGVVTLPSSDLQYNQVKRMKSSDTSKGNPVSFKKEKNTKNVIVADGSGEQRPCLDLENVASVVLIVGHQTVCKRGLAESILRVENSPKIKIRLSDCLPLRALPAGSVERPRIDFVIFVLDITNKLSVTQFNESIKHLGKEYLQGRACALITNCQERSAFAFDISAIDATIDMCDIHALYMNNPDEISLNNMSKRIVRLLQVAGGYSEYTSIMNLKTCEYYIVNSTTLPEAPEHKNDI
eukprot:Nk52_evm46s296 gene=Nk52_evmTU46s296